MRRRAVIAGGLAGISGLAGCLDPNGTGEPPDQSGPGDGVAADAIGLEPVITGLTQPVGFAAVPDEDVRYVIERPGRLRVHDADGLRDDPLFDLSDAIVFEDSWEQGLLGIALHPSFPDTRRLFYRFSAHPREGTPHDYSHTTLLREAQVSADHREIEATRTIMELPQPGPVHNAGDILFGPAGFLYVTTGDGGGGYGDHGPGHAEDWYAENAGGNGQDTQASLHGGILRIDVDRPPTEHPRTDPEAPDAPDADGGYAIPPGNPLVEGNGHRPEYFAWGFRNPWQASFHGDQLIVADVAALMREVNVVEAGGNYGWNVKDGTRCFDTDNPRESLESCPTETPENVRGGEPLRDPVIEYEHPGSSSAVIGGYVYEGTDVPAIAGRYVFADLNPLTVGGIFVADPGEADATWSHEILPVAGDVLDEETMLFAFGREEEALFVLAGGFDTGQAAMFRIVAPE